MRGNPESLLISREERQARDEMLRSPERRELNAAMERFASRFGYGDAAMWASVRATNYTLLGNPRSTREEQLRAANALFEDGE
jgi:hypothetical protein